MGNLFFNTTLHEQLKLSVKFWLSLLPFVMMFLIPSLLLLLPEDILEMGVGDTALTVMLPIFIILTIGASAGWAMNRLIARFYFRWFPQKIEDVFSKSEVPHNWFKLSGFEEYRKEVLLSQAQQEEHLSRSKVKIAFRAALVSYLLFGGLTVIFIPFVEGMAISNWKFFLWPLPLFGLAFGALSIFLNYWTAYRFKITRDYISGSSYLGGISDNSPSKSIASKTSLFDSLLNYGNLAWSVLMLLVCIFISLLVFYYSALDDEFKVPPKSALVKVSGQISDVKKTEESIQINLSTALIPYNYPKKFGSYDVVFNSLKGSTSQSISIYIKPRAQSTEYKLAAENRKIYEIYSGNEVIRSYNEIKTSAYLHRIVYFVFGLLMLAGSGFMGLGIWIQFKQVNKL
jgi:hypothetical protein